MRRLLLLLITTTLLLAACSGAAVDPTVPTRVVLDGDGIGGPDAERPPGETPSGGEEPMPPGGPVPGARLIAADGGRQEGVIGTRCWNGLCLDMVGIMAFREPVTLQPGELVRFELDEGVPTTAHLRVLDWVLGEVDEGNDPAIADPTAPVVESGTFDDPELLEWVVPARPGEYAVSLFAAYEGEGDLSYGWHVRVAE